MRKRTGQIIILLTATCLLLSCSSLGRKKVCLPQLSFEISDKGLCEVNQTNRNGPKVISYFYCKWTGRPVDRCTASMVALLNLPSMGDQQP